MSIQSHPEHAALRAGAEALAQEFAGTFNAQTITRFLESSYDDLAASATTLAYLPVLAERFARERLTALARLKGHRPDGKPVVLFLCMHNAGRSQMALGFFHHYAVDQAIGWSGGSTPAGGLSPIAVEVMAEVGIDISKEYPKPWTDEVVQAADVVITMGCGEACPIIPGKRYEEWSVQDPETGDLAHARSVRDAIREQVVGLLGELGIATDA